MKTYEVLVRIEEYIHVEANSLIEAELEALLEFDPTAHNARVVEAYPLEHIEED